MELYFEGKVLGVGVQAGTYIGTIKEIEFQERELEQWETSTREMEIVAKNLLEQYA